MSNERSLSEEITEGFKALEAMRNNKPVAYGMLTFCKNCGEQNPYSAKTLTDEEIKELYGVYNYKYGFDEIEFARAILRKAQE